MVSAPKSSTGSCDAAPSAAPTVLVYMHHMCINTCIDITLTHNVISLCTAGRLQRGTSYHWCCSSVPAVQGCGAMLASAVHAETELQDALLVLLLCGAAALLQNAKQQHARVRGSVLHSWMLYSPHAEMHWQQQLQHVNTRVAYTASQMHW
ncbi:hypothetical protein COO60DRAFT_1571371 [Scenedesmus sp. NREL 46B-D3]|nr:hypothetical protein COO60DRAFT_1571371 [Scenedesmus sp. NREL 46B-D3]